MAVTFPRDLVLEAYLGRWVDITALAEGRSLRQVEPVTVTWGLPSEQAKALAPPSTAEGVLNNIGGHWTPGNPMSDYWAYLQGRNVPTRLRLRVSRDGFGQTLPSSWGTTDTGESWTPDGAAYSEGSGVGTQQVGAAGSFAVIILGDSYGDCMIRASCTVNINNVTGGAIEPLNLVLRYQGVGAMTGEHYLLRLSVDASEVLTATIFHSGLGAISPTVAVPGLVDSLTPKDLRAAFYVEGQTLRGKVYKRGPANDVDQFEPLGWHVAAHHERLTGGFAGIRSGIAAGNSNSKPIAYLYDDWDLSLVRHSGELARLQPSWDESHRIKKATIKCADITQRLGRPQRPALSSAPRRYLAKNLEFTTTDFWPLDESATAPAHGLNAVAGGESAQFVRFAALIERGAVKWGQTDSVLTTVPGFVALSNDGELICPVNRAPLGTVSSVMWAMRLSPDAGGNVWVDTGVGSQFAFVFYSDPGGKYELFGNPGSVSLASGFMTDNGLAGRWVTMGLTIFAVDATHIGYHLNVDGQTLGVGSWASGVAYTSASAVRLHAPQPTDGGEPECAFSSLFVTAARFDTIIAGSSTSYGARASNVLKGWPGERALARAFRLCFEENIPFDYFGDFNTTPPMGPQRPIPLLDQLVECAEADQAVLYGSRYTPGITLRSRRSMIARSATATLSYSSGHVAKELKPAGDDRPTANLVRAERINGGFTIVEQTAGVMNTKDPGTDSDAIGKSPADAKVNVESDASLPHVGGWVRALGTTPEIRFPKITVDLAARELTTGPDPTLPARSVLQLSVGDRLLVQGLTAADVYRDLDQLVRGGTEVYTNVRLHKVTLNTAPYEKYRGAFWNDGVARHDTQGTTFNSSLGEATTGARNVTVVGPIWNTNPANYPINVECEGEVMTISGVTGAGPTQSMTISARSVNGVVKSHPAGAALRLATRNYHA